MEALVCETAGAHGLSTTVSVFRISQAIIHHTIILTDCFNYCLVETLSDLKSKAITLQFLTKDE